MRTHVQVYRCVSTFLELVRHTGHPPAGSTKFFAHNAKVGDEWIATRHETSIDKKDLVASAWDGSCSPPVYYYDLSGYLPATGELKVNPLNAQSNTLLVSI